MSIVIKTENLCRTYKTYQKQEGLWQSIQGLWNRQYIEKLALAPTNLQIESGRIIGLVGANGAGKTTLLKMLSGLIYPSSGTVSVLGFKPWERNNAFLKRISILLGQKNQLWWDISPMDSYSLLTEIYDLKPKQAKQRIHELAELLDCKHVLHIQLRRLSLGERMKMELIGALLHEPEILFLDEPTIGLDIVAQGTIRKFLSEYVKQKGPTVILTSHYMDDIARLADQLLLISKGNIVYNGTVDAFMQKSQLKQTLIFSLSESLSADIRLNENHVLTAGTQEYEISLAPEEMPFILTKVASLKGVHTLKIEEADFENVIHEFLKKESRIFQTRDS